MNSISIDEVHIYPEEKVEEFKNLWKDKPLYYKVYFWDSEPDWYELTIDCIEFKKVVHVKSKHGSDYTDNPLVNELISLLQYRDEDQHFKSDVLSKLNVNTDAYRRKCEKEDEVIMSVNYKCPGGEVMSTSYECPCHSNYSAVKEEVDYKYSKQ